MFDQNKQVQPSRNLDMGFANPGARAATLGRTLAPPPFQLKTDPVQKSEPEGEYPYDAQVISPWSAALRKEAKKDPAHPHQNTLADIPNGETLKVIGQSGGWLEVEWQGINGYVSGELVQACTLPGQEPQSEPAGPKDYQSLINEELGVTTRDEWGAREHRPHSEAYDYYEYEQDLAEVYHSITIHHSGNANHHEMSEVQDIHMDSPDYDAADVGYHYGIDLQGNIIEGRPINVRGSHVDMGNTGRIGIVFLADLNEQFWDKDDQLTAKMEASLLRLIGTLQAQFPNIEFLGGHQEYNEGRSCPGNIPMAKMDSWRSSTGLTKPEFVTRQTVFEKLNPF